MIRFALTCCECGKGSPCIPFQRLRRDHGSVSNWLESILLNGHGSQFSILVGTEGVSHLSRTFVNFPDKEENRHCYSIVQLKMSKFSRSSTAVSEACDSAYEVGHRPAEPILVQVTVLEQFGIGAEGIHISEEPVHFL